MHFIFNLMKNKYHHFVSLFENIDYIESNKDCSSRQKTLRCRQIPLASRRKSVSILFEKGGYLMNLLIKESPLQVLPSLVMQVGLNEVIVRQQLHFRSLNSTTIRAGHKWGCKTY